MIDNYKLDELFIKNINVITEDIELYENVLQLFSCKNFRESIATYRLYLLKSKIEVDYEETYRECLADVTIFILINDIYKKCLKQDNKANESFRYYINLVKLLSS